MVCMVCVVRVRVCTIPGKYFGEPQTRGRPGKPPRRSTALHGGSTAPPRRSTALHGGSTALHGASAADVSCSSAAV